MPKKKLTKAQVKTKLKRMNNAMYDLFLDKVGYGTDSYFKMSIAKANDLLTLLKSLENKLSFGRK